MDVISNEIFFDSVSEFYGGMIEFEKALQQRNAALKKYLNKTILTAADLGCGTGMDSIALSLNGIKVTAFDISEGMLNKAKENANKYSAEIDFHKFSIEDIPAEIHNHFDLITSLGNTLANINYKKIESALAIIYKMLSKGGILLIQILNFEKLEKDKERIINITHNDKIYFIRFYDFLYKEINFNILQFNKTNPKERKLLTTKLYPYSRNELKKLLTDAGFERIDFYGNLEKVKFEFNYSKDLVILAEK